MSSGLAIYEPASVDAAIEILSTVGADARLVAGSTAITIMLRQRLIAPSALVSLGRVGGTGRLREIREEDGQLVIGSLVTHREVEQSPLVRRLVPVLAETFALVANVRVRNAATVGGVVAEADYASDPPTSLRALDAQIEAQGPSGTRRIDVAAFFRGFYDTALEPLEVVTAVRVPIPPPGTFGVYEKFVTRSSEDRPCIGAAAIVRFVDGRCVDLRVALGATTETPTRHPELEALAHGTALGPDVVRQISAGYSAKTDPLDDMRGSAWYRTQVIEVWVRRAIEHAVTRARAA